MPEISRRSLGVKERKKSTEKSYQYYSDWYNSKTWKDLRTLYLQAHPLCQCCEEHGRITGGQAVHHIVPWTRGADQRHKEQLFYNEANLMTVCKKCHSLLHKKDEDHRQQFLNSLTEEEYNKGHGIEFLK